MAMTSDSGITCVYHTKPLASFLGLFVIEASEALCNGLCCTISYTMTELHTHSTYQVAGDCSGDHGIGTIHKYTVQNKHDNEEPKCLISISLQNKQLSLNRKTYKINVY